ncbi:hypothetical protein ACM61V_12235 [Sphingomonas sp. TX0543]|uniref:hypothetical protein n=1 Tax=unclassified Sphingomonas TaxID=196159 RepID=UPI0020166888|nr:hypothetical protein [Sphingomonas sp. 3P27F8]
MSRILRLFLMLIASSLLMSATVHARELPGVATIECSGAVHTDGDADQSQGDSDKAMPHHHGTCHSSAMQIPSNDEVRPSLDGARMGPLAGADTVLASSTVSPGLRPPNA